MARLLLGSVWLGVTLFTFAAQADSIVHVNHPVRGNLIVDWSELSPSPKHPGGGFMNLSGKHSHSIPQFSQLNVGATRPPGSSFAGSYGLFPRALAGVGSVPAGQDRQKTSWMLAGSESRLEGTLAIERTLAKRNGKDGGDLWKKLPGHRLAAIVDSDAHAIVAVHEPSTLLILGSGLICLAIVARMHVSRSKVSGLAVEALPNAHAES